MQLGKKLKMEQIGGEEGKDEDVCSRPIGGNVIAWVSCNVIVVRHIDWLIMGLISTFSVFSKNKLLVIGYIGSA